MQLLSSCLSGFSACLEAERYAFVWLREEIRLDTENTLALPNLTAFEGWIENRSHECRTLMGQLPFVQGETLATLKATVRAETTDPRVGEAILASLYS